LRSSRSQPQPDLYRTLGAALTLAACTACRPSPAAPGRTLLFLNRSPAALVDGVSWAPDPDSSRLVAWDGELHVAATFTGPRLATPVAVSALGSRLLVSERTGDAVVFDTRGTALREWEPVDQADVYASARDRVASARSPYYVQVAVEPDTAPLIRLLDAAGRVVGRIGTIHVPAVPFLTELANAGALAMDRAGAVYFAPLIRDEIRKYDATGALRWTASRGRFARETDPVLDRPRASGLNARYAVVNLALALGPDGRLYALGGDDSAATRLRVDVLDTASGKIVATRRLDPGETAVLVDRDGRLETRNADTLLAAVPRREREPFGPPFVLANLHGDTVRLGDFAGKVLLINFWASWCDPCREEFPRMAELYRTTSRHDFAIAAISDDVDLGKMLDFVQRFRPPFPVLVGGGRMRGAYHYRGLPYSVLLDRRGRVIERIFGFGGDKEFQSLSATIAKEVRAP
jgi:thiol-disulfide isomerase/thioredoxin